MCVGISFEEGNWHTSNIHGGDLIIFFLNESGDFLELLLVFNWRLVGKTEYLSTNCHGHTELFSWITVADSMFSEGDWDTTDRHGHTEVIWVFIVGIFVFSIGNVMSIDDDVLAPLEFSFSLEPLIVWLWLDYIFNLLGGNDWSLGSYDWTLGSNDWSLGGNDWSLDNNITIFLTKVNWRTINNNVLTEVLFALHT